MIILVNICLYQTYIPCPWCSTHDLWSSFFMFVYLRHKYKCPQCPTYDLWLSFCMFVYSRYKYWVHNVWQIIYDHRYSCFGLTDIKIVSLILDRWSMFIVLYFVFYRYEYRVLNIRQMIYYQHSSNVCIPEFLSCPYCLTYHLCPSLYMIVSSRVQ